jgi:6-pyruvoyltetrahydropterin/6-carboxytetrahydropterin synthase
MPDYSVRIAGDNLIYSAAHFIMLPGGICEPLHGHNYRVAVELKGPLDELDCVIDFAGLLQIMKSILAELDHVVLLPTRHSAILVSAGEDEVEVRFGPRRWVFPRAECRLLPLVSTTVEQMANYLAERLLQTLTAQRFARPQRVRIELEESPGCWAVCEIPPE